LLSRQEDRAGTTALRLSRENQVWAACGIYGKRQIQPCGAFLRLLTNLLMQKIFSMGGLRSEIGYREPHESTSSMGG
jgi:hypothetical protein